MLQFSVCLYPSIVFVVADDFASLLEPGKARRMALASLPYTNCHSGDLIRAFCAPPLLSSSFLETAPLLCPSSMIDVKCNHALELCIRWEIMWFCHLPLFTHQGLWEHHHYQGEWLGTFRPCVFHTMIWYLQWRDITAAAGWCRSGAGESSWGEMVSWVTLSWAFQA